MFAAVEPALHRNGRAVPGLSHFSSYQRRHEPLLPIPIQQYLSAMARHSSSRQPRLGCLAGHQTATQLTLRVCVKRGYEVGGF